MTSKFKERFSDYLRKRIHPAETISHNLRVWLDEFKGKEDSITKKLLFTQDTLTAVENCCQKAQYITDVVPTQQMYRKIKRGRRNRVQHDMLKYKSLRCESLIESFHQQLSHFANGGTGQELADFLNLIGTCRHNVRMRHRIWWNQLDLEERANIIEYFAKEPMYYNHTNLSVVNQLAMEAGCEDVPFKAVRPLPPDNGERFFGEYYMENKQRETCPVTKQCQCLSCSSNPSSLTHLYPTTDMDDDDEDSQDSEEIADGEDDVPQPEGTWFAHKPTRRLPSLVPTRNLKKPPQIAPRPPTGSRQQGSYPNS
jgi:hypothetical protein